MTTMKEPSTKGDCVDIEKKGESQRLYKCLSIDEGNRHVKREQKTSTKQPTRSLKKKNLNERERELIIGG